MSARFARRGLLLAATVVLMVGALALAWLLDDEGGDRTDRLPEPRPPITDAFDAPAGTGLAWSWVSPVPRAMPPWLDVAVNGPGQVAFAGRRGEAGRLVGGNLYRWRTGTDAVLWGIDWLGDNEAVAVGEGGTVRVLDPGEPQAMESGTEATLRAVAALPEGGALAVGDGGAVLRVAGGRVEAMPPPVKEDLLDLHVADDGTALIVGTSGTILRWADGGFDPEVSGTAKTLRAVAACPGGRDYAAGDSGIILVRTGEGWAALPDTGGEAWSGLACDDGRMVAVGRDGGVRLVLGRRSVALESGTKAGLYAVDGSPHSLTWLVAEGGRIGVVDPARIRWRTAGPIVPIFDLELLAGTLVAVGGWGAVLRQEKGRLREVDTPTDAALSAVEPLDERRLLAVGDGGALLVITWNAVELLDPPVGSGWRDLVTDDGEVLVVGAKGALLRGSPGAWRTSRVPDVGTLWSVSGAPGNAVAVGDDGAILRIGPDGAERVDCGEQGTLRGVARLESGTWIVGDGGVVLHLTEEGCEEEHRAGADLYAIGRGPRGDPVAVGRHGAIIERDATGGWDSVALDANRAHLRTVVSTERYVYVAGSGGVVLRHPRIN